MGRLDTAKNPLDRTLPATPVDHEPCIGQHPTHDVSHQAVGKGDDDFFRAPFNRLENMTHKRLPVNLLKGLRTTEADSRAAREDERRVHEAEDRNTP